MASTQRDEETGVGAEADAVDDEVEEAGLESFPASDPPSSWAGHD